MRFPLGLLLLPHSEFHCSPKCSDISSTIAGRLVTLQKFKEERPRAEYGLSEHLQEVPTGDKSQVTLAAVYAEKMLAEHLQRNQTSTLHR